MVNLPDGTVLAESCTSPSQLYIYTPSGSPLPQGQPTIQSVSAGSGSCNTTCYHLTGTGLSGISEGASYGDDEQMATDFPLVRLTSASGKVQYARTYNWTRAGLAPQTRGSTDFALPVGILAGRYQLQLIANGYAVSAARLHGWHLSAGRRLEQQRESMRSRS
jgi:hypothetical protein